MEYDVISTKVFGGRCRGGGACCWSPGRQRDGSAPWWCWWSRRSVSGTSQCSPGPHSCGPEGPQTLFSLTVQNQECVHRQEPRPGGLWGHSSMALRRRSGPGRGRGGDPLGSRALELEIFVLWATGAAVLPELPLCVEPRASLSGGGAVCRHSHRPHIPGLLPPCCLPG